MELSTKSWPTVFNSSAALRARDPVSLCHDLMLAWTMITSKQFAPHPRLGHTFEAAKKQLGIPSIKSEYLAVHLRILQEKAA